MDRIPIKTEDMVNLYNNGLSMREVGRRLNVSATCVKKRLKDVGIVSRFKHNYDYIIGQKFGKLTVLGISSIQNTYKSGNKLYDCLCDCNNINITQANSYQLRTGIKLSYGCSKHLKGVDNKCWKGFGEISSSKWSSIKSKLETRKLKFEITIEFAWNLFLKQNRKCALSGIELVFKTAKNEFSETTASLDRINSDKDYTEDNVQWVHKDVNWMKQDFNQDYFIEICDKISNHIGVNSEKVL